MEAATLTAGGALAGAAAAGLVLGQWGFEGIVRARRAQAVVGGDGPGAAPWLLRPVCGGGGRGGGGPRVRAPPPPAAAAAGGAAAAAGMRRAPDGPGRLRPAG